jgi:regulation of enolase protein 1 (concanavalin A-like superfamily)
MKTRATKSGPAKTVLLVLAIFLVALVVLAWRNFGMSSHETPVAVAGVVPSAGNQHAVSASAHPATGQVSTPGHPVLPLGLPVSALARTSPGSAPGSAASFAKNPSAPMAVSREPQGEWAKRVPAVSEYAPAIPAAHVAALQEFQKNFPGVDPTETWDFYDAVFKERQTYGTKLTGGSSARYTAWLARTEAMRSALVTARGGHVGIALAGTDESGSGFAITGFEGVKPVYMFTQNVNAAISTNADRMRMNPAFDPVVGDKISGDGLYVSVNDAALIAEHDEFQLPNGGGSRIIHKGDVPPIDASYLVPEHSTHVAGTVGAWGHNPSIIGMAPRVWFRSFIQQYTTEVYSFGMSYPGQSVDGTTINPRNAALQIRSVMGTTSLGRYHDFADPSRCVYDSTCKMFDQAMWDNPYYIQFYAAGNYAQANPDDRTISYYATLSVEYPNAKNITAIGAVEDATRDAAGHLTGGGALTGFSSRGPTYDGRIKPDLVANGYRVLSSTVNRTSSATNLPLSASGTSMATPNAAGSAVLLVDYFNKRFPGHFLRSSTLRALLVNAADDLGNPGPDYAYGWGLVNVSNSAEIIKRYANVPASRVVAEDSLSANGTFTASYTCDGTGPIRATLAWIDPAGPYLSPSTGDRSTRLVNDLNLRLISQGGTVYRPYVMPFVTGDGSAPAYDDSLYTAAATTGNNTTDNVEQVVIATPPAGNYTLEVTRSATLTDGADQKFSLAVSGMAQTLSVAPAISSVSPAVSNGTDDFLLAVAGSGFLLGSDVILRQNGFADVVAYGAEVTGSRIECRINTATLGKGRWDVVVRGPDHSTEAVLPKAFLNQSPGLVYINDFENAAEATGFVLEGGAIGWQIGAPNYQNGSAGPAAAFSGTKILGYNLSGNYPINMAAPKYARSPAIDCSHASGLMLSFRRWLGVERSPWDNATVEVSPDGTNWTTVWANPGTPTPDLQDTSWTLQTYDVSTVADGQPTVFIRWGMGPTDDAVIFCGWNIDDVELDGAIDIAPAFTSMPPTAARVGHLISYTVTASDEASPWDTLVLAATGLPSWLAFTDNGNGTGTLSGTPPSSGSATVTLSVTDGAFTAYQTVNLSISAGTENSPPFISTDILPVAVNADYSATVRAFDADGNAIALTVGALPPGLIFTDNGDGTGTLSGMPTKGTVGTFNVAVSASDGTATTQKILSLRVDFPAPPVITVEATDTVCSEQGPAPGVFTLTRTGDTASALTVSYSLGGKATNGGDYSAPGRSITFTANRSTANVTITPIDDSSYEPPETVEFAISQGPAYEVGSSGSASLTITDNDKPTVSVFADPASVNEGDASASFVFARSGATSLGGLTVNYSVSGTATGGADYPLISGTITIPAGQSSATVDVTPRQDVVIEPLETVVVTLTAHAAYIIAASPDNSATMAISDDTEQPMVTVAATDNEAGEPAQGRGNGTFTITRAGSTARAHTANLIIGGTATPGSDYTPLPTSVTIPAGQSTVTVPVTVLDDAEAEPDETVTLTLQAGAGFAVGAASSATVNIYDDEPAQVRAETGDSLCAEAAAPDTGTFILRRLGLRNSAIAVGYAMSGAATNGTDYTTLNGTATIAANSGFTTLAVTPINDALVEGTETAVLTVSAGTGYTVAVPSSAGLDIRDDETVDVNVTVGNATCIEQASPVSGNFTITRSSASASPLIVNFTITGTATNGTDYTTLNGAATIPANATSANVAVTPIDDALAEGTESVILALAPGGPTYDIGDTRSQTIWIQDNESPSISVAATDASAAEAEGGAANPGQFTISVSSAPAADLTVPYTVGGIAINGVDFTRLPGNVVIPAGQTSVTLSVDVVDDNLAEAAETVTLTLGQVAGYNTATTSAVQVNIAASDATEANIVAADPSAAEKPLDAAQLVVTLSKPSATATTVAYTVSGTATNGADHTTLTGTLNIPAGSNTAYITLTPIDDTDSEGPETATITLTPSATYTVGANASATATIIDDESDGTQTLVVSSTSVSVVEGSSATFSVRLDPAPIFNTAVTVAFKSGDTDLSVQNGANLTFTPANWNTPQSVTLAAAKDVDTVNGTATFLVTSPARPSVLVTATESDTDVPPVISISGPATTQIELPDLTDSLVLNAAATAVAGTPSVTWSQVSGPSGQNALIANAGSVTTSATFPAAGTYVLRATASDGTLTSSADVTVIVGGAWTSPTGGDIGTPALAGNFTTNGTAYTVRGAGSDIGSTADQGYFLSSSISGNFTASARVLSQSYNYIYAKAGLMARQSTVAGSINAAIFHTMTTLGVSYQCRSALNGNTTAVNTGSTNALPYWVRLVRSGNTLSGWRSPDGSTWTQVGNQTITMTDPVLVGLAVTSHNTGVTNTAVFDNVRVTRTPNAAPQVNPGTAPAATTGAAAALAATASDDGLPSGSSLSTTWSKVSGPGTAAFGNASALNTTVTFSAPGSYVLRLSASDGSAGVFQDLAVTVTGSAYDAWIAGYPGAAWLAATGEDPDHDGLPNLLEYALGGNPAQSDPNILPAASTTGSGSATYLTLTFRRARADVTYTVQGSSNFSAWSNIPFTSVAVGEQQTVSDTVTLGSADSKRFLRLKVTMP